MPETEIPPVPRGDIYFIAIFFRRIQLKKRKETRTKKVVKHIDYVKLLFMGFLCVTLTAVMCLPAFAATPTIWEKATEIMKDVYNQILLISTVAAVVCASVALLLMNFSKRLMRMFFVCKKLK